MIHFLYAGVDAERPFRQEPELAEFAEWARYGAGLLSTSAATYCLLPRVMQRDASRDQRVADVGLLMRALRRYILLREGNRNVSEDTAEQAGASCNEPHWATRLHAAVSLLEDFYRNGTWQRHTVRPAHAPPGAIHWPRTVQRSALLLSQGNFVHDPLVYARRMQNRDDPLWKVWAAALRLAVELLAAGHGCLLPDPTATTSASAALAMCRDHGRRVFDDRSRSIVGWLIAFFEFAATSRRRDNVSVRWLRIEHEEHLWEAVTRNAITGADRADTTSLAPLPRGRWFTSEVPRRESGLILDCRHVVSDEGTDWLIVADAKRYEDNAEITGADLYKQWLYAFFSSKTHDSRGFERARIVNVFVVPSSRRGVAAATGLYRFTSGGGDAWNGLGTVMRLELDYRRALDLFHKGRSWPGLSRHIVTEWNRLRSASA
jgi:hypothetical protein